MGPLILKRTIVIGLSLATTQAQADLNQVKTALGNQPYEIARPANNDSLFSLYCEGDPLSAEVPQPNYQNPLVFAAAQKLTETKTLADQRLQELRTEQIATTLSYLQNAAQGLPSPEHSPELAQAFSEASEALIGMTPETFSEEETTKIQESLDKAVIFELSRSLQKMEPLLKSSLDQVNLEKILGQIRTVRNQLAQANLEPKRDEVLLSLQSLKADLSATMNLFPSYNQADLLMAVQDLETNANSLLTEVAPAFEYEVLNVVEQLRVLKIELNKSQLGYQNETQYYFEQLKWYLDSFKNNLPDVYAQLFYMSEDSLFTVKMEIFRTETEKVWQEARDLEDTIQSESEQSLSANSINSLISFSYTLQSWMVAFPESLTQVSILGAQQTMQVIQSLSVRNWLRDFDQLLSLLPTQNFPEGVLESSYTISWISTQILDNSSVPTKIKTQVSQLKKWVGTVNAQQKLGELPNYLAQLATATETSYELTYPYQELMTTLEVALPEYFQANPAVINELKSNSTIANYASEITGQLASLGLMGKNRESDHFYFYSGVLRLYGLNGRDQTEAAYAAGANLEAHRFLTQLCGEYRDRATMIEAKLKWITNINILVKDTDNVRVIEPETLAAADNVWMRITSAAYDPYLVISEEIWEAKRANNERYLQIGGQTVDMPVDGFTVCETKYIFAQYVAQDRYLEDYTEYQKGYEEFKVSCPLEDLTDYYDFRGDSNFKHYSPESNAMIWHATSLARGCSSPFIASDRFKSNLVKNEDCENYFRHPFASRFQAARAGLATWLFRDEAYAERFSAQDSPVVVHTHLEPHLAPFGFGFDLENNADRTFDFNPDWLSISGAWTSPDMGFNSLTGLDGVSSLNTELAYSLIRDAVDRHTDWYNSGYNDGNGVSRAQAYSPFVASSYVMTSSDNFTSCGTTVQCPPDGLKRWMFIFRIKAENWYTPLKLSQGEPVDFTRMWFDETSFGRSGLADSEHAWDRLGTPMEEELDSILYLINLEAYQGDEEG